MSSTLDQPYDPFADHDRPGFFTAPRLTQLSAVFLLALLIARTIMSELVRDPFESSPGQTYQPLMPGPTTSIILNLLSLVPALLILLRRVIDPTYRLAKVCSPFLFIALGLLAFISYTWSADRFPTIITASTLVASAVLCWAASQLFRSWGRFRLLLAILIGLLAVHAAQGIYYRHVDLPDLQKNVERSKDNILRERGFEPDSFAAEQFLRRISGGEMIGFGSSPNTYGAAIVMLGIASAGLIAHGIRTKRDPVLLALTAIPLLAGAYVASFTRSNTAFATPILAALIFGAAVLLGTRTTTHRKTFFIAGVALVLLGLAAIIGHGLYHGSLPSASLNFRWRYWTAAYHLFLDHPFRGTGYSNFAETYLQYRLPAAAEEIRDPHNLLVRFATELGAAGLALCLAWLTLFWWEATRPIKLSPPDERSTSDIRHPPSDIPPSIPAFALIIVLGISLNILLSIDFTADVNYVIIEVFKRFMYAGVMLVFGALALIRNRADSSIDDQPADWTVLAATIALGMFLVHNLIDFSFFESSPITIFSALLGGVLAIRSPQSTTPKPTLAASTWNVGRVAALASIAATLAIAFIYFTQYGLPVTRAESLARAGDESLRLAKVNETSYPDRFVQSANLYLAAAQAFPQNPEYWMRAYRGYLFSQAADPTTVRATLDHAIAADPLHIRARLERARYEQRLALTGGTAPDFPRAIAEFAESLRLNPNDVVIRLEYAALLAQAGKPAAAADQIELALKYDSLLDPTEPKRLSPKNLAENQAKLAELRAKSPPTTQP